jgi:hypothetical protein
MQCEDATGVLFLCRVCLSVTVQWGLLEKPLEKQLRPIFLRLRDSLRNRNLHI